VRAKRPARVPVVLTGEVRALLAYMQEEDYVFITLEQLLLDFERDVNEWS
jgi:hypothetical protein